MSALVEHLNSFQARVTNYTSDFDVFAIHFAIALRAVIFSVVVTFAAGALLAVVAATLKMFEFLVHAQGAALRFAEKGWKNAATAVLALYVVVFTVFITGAGL